MLVPKGVALSGYSRANCWDRLGSVVGVHTPQCPLSTGNDKDLRVWGALYKGNYMRVLLESHSIQGGAYSLKIS